MRTYAGTDSIRAREAARLMAPTSIAIIGASDRSRWSSTIYENLKNSGYKGTIYLVNNRGGLVHGQPAFASCVDLPGTIDMGVILVPETVVESVIDELADAGAYAAMILTSGFAETGPDGAARQDAILVRARERSISLLGPNSLGFINHAGSVVAWATPFTPSARRDGVAIVSQSGAVALFMAQFSGQKGIGLSHVIATGNEADLDITDFMNHLLEQPETRAIAIFVETVREPDRFRRCAARALAMGKPLIVLKVGKSEVTARSAEAHTGALVGDDAVFDGLCLQYGVIRVDSVEDLIVTADIAAKTGPLGPGGLAILSNSGGICEIAADRAYEFGIVLPELSSITKNYLKKLLPGYGTPHNPLDLTGGVDPAQIEAIVSLLATQPDVAAVLCPFYRLPTNEAEVSGRLTELHDGITRGFAAIDVPGILVSYTETHVNEMALNRAAEGNMPYHACGLDRALSALSGVIAWSNRYRIGSADAGVKPKTKTTTWSNLPRSEHQTLTFLAAHGVPTVPMTLVRNEEAAADAVGVGLLVIKIASPNISHKSDIGGVILNVDGAVAARAAYRDVIAAAATSHPKAQIDGALVMPMRGQGLELFVGIRRDPQWGLVLALGMGGVWVEILKDFTIRLLPVNTAEIRVMLGELRAGALLDGARGVPAADLDAVIDAVQAICTAALAAGDNLEILEVNPLWISGDQVEVLDALMEWN
jgi:acyl-CoA synthetase (NDP forming)